MATVTKHLTSAPHKSSLYFGYGSNLWLAQMKRRCPESNFVGVALLRDWRWMVTIRGYANVVPSTGDVVYGLVYELSAEDEMILDRYEGVPISYVKETFSLEYVGVEEGAVGKFDGLVYVDVERVVDDKPKAEYIHRMNMGIKDALIKGVPETYIDSSLRPFIPKVDDHALENVNHVTVEDLID